MTPFEPFTLAPSLTLRNRIMKSAMGEGAAHRDGRPSPALLELYRAWAAGGTGLLVTGMAYVRAGYNFTPRDLGLHADHVVAAHRELTSSVHAQGAAIFAQLCHAPPQLPRERLRTVGATSVSPGFSKTNFRLHRALADDEIWQVIRDFGQAARRARAAGYDGVQLHAAHGYLLSRFLSPKHNQRRDRWGGDFEGRLRLVREVFAEIARQAGADFPVAVKLNAHDGEPNGLTLEMSVRIGKVLASLGAVLLEISAGTADVGLGFYPCRGSIPQKLSEDFLKSEFWWAKAALPAMRPIVRRAARTVALREEAYFRAEAERFGREVDVPVACVGGLRSIATVERLQSTSKIALYSLARPLLCEPDLPARWQASDRSAARCTSCNKCFVGLGVGESLHCWLEHQ